MNDEKGDKWKKVCNELNECFELIKTNEFWFLFGGLLSITLFIVSPAMVLMLIYQEVWSGFRDFNIFSIIFISFLVILAYWYYFKFQKNINEIKKWLIKRWTGED